MPAHILDGKALAAAIRSEITEATSRLKETHGIVPGLAVVLVGDNPASKIYVRNKEKACLAAGFHTEQHTLPAETTETDLLALIDRLNHDKKLHGILVQLPLPEGLDEQRILQAIDPAKDADGFHPLNQGKLMAGLVQSGKLKYREDVAQGIGTAPQAFIGMLQGKNQGKQLVQLSEL